MDEDEDEDEAERQADLDDVQDRVRRSLRDAGWDAEISEEGDSITIYDEVSEHDVAVVLDWA